MNTWIILGGVIIVAGVFFVMGYRLGMIAGYERAEKLLGEIVEEQAAERGWVKESSIVAVDRAIYGRKPIRTEGQP